MDLDQEYMDLDQDLEHGLPGSSSTLPALPYLPQIKPCRQAGVRETEG